MGCVKGGSGACERGEGGVCEGWEVWCVKGGSVGCVKGGSVESACVSGGRHVTLMSPSTYTCTLPPLIHSESPATFPPPSSISTDGLPLQHLLLPSPPPPPPHTLSPLYIH